MADLPQRAPPAVPDAPEASEDRYRAVVVGGSAGALETLLAILETLTAEFPLPILVAQHLHPEDGGALARHLDDVSVLKVFEARDKQPVRPGEVYVAPPDYHLLVEPDEMLALSVDEKVNHSRPSIDVLFESAARVWTGQLIGVLLSGASDDGARGLGLIERLGGTTLVEDPNSARYPLMPEVGLKLATHSRPVPSEQIGQHLRRLAKGRAPLWRRARWLFGREYK